MPIVCWFERCLDAVLVVLTVRNVWFMSAHRRDCSFVIPIHLLSCVHTHSIYLLIINSLTDTTSTYSRRVRPINRPRVDFFRPAARISPYSN
jgi:hypothetical protein